MSRSNSVANVAGAEAVDAERDLTKVYKIRGGWESDLVLHPSMIAKLETLLKSVSFDGYFDSVLDIGVGHGGFSRELVKLSRALLLTDYMPEHVGPTAKRIAKENPQTKISSQRLDIGQQIDSQLVQAGSTKRFDLITCLSVMMKLNPEQSEKAIQELYDLLNPGGSLFVATISRSVAARVYSRASWLGQDVYIPRMPGIKKDEMNEEVLSSLVSNPFDLAEFYPQDFHYSDSASKTGGAVCSFDFVADQRCYLAKNQRTPSIYRKIGEGRYPLWSCVKVTKPPKG